MAIRKKARTRSSTGKNASSKSAGSAGRRARASAPPEAGTAKPANTLEQENLRLTSELAQLQQSFSRALELLTHSQVARFKLQSQLHHMAVVSRLRKQRREQREHKLAMALRTLTSCSDQLLQAGVSRSS